MINSPTKKGIMLGFLFLSLCAACTRPGDTVLNKQEETTSSPAVPEKEAPRLYTVEIENMKFEPAVLTVHMGDTVSWINKDMVTHCITEEANKTWTSSKILHGASWKMTVSTSCDYYCAIHMVMKGKIIVE